LGFDIGDALGDWTALANFPAILARGPGISKRMAHGYRDDAYFFLRIRAASPVFREQQEEGVR